MINEYTCYDMETLSKCQDIANQFHKIPRQVRFLVSSKLDKRLRELNGFVRVHPNNPLLKYPSDRHIVEGYDKNPYENLKHLLEDENLEMFNEEIYNDIIKKISNTKNHEEITVECRCSNEAADFLYIVNYPEAKDWAAILKIACGTLGSYFRYGTAETLVKYALDDIDYITGSNVLPFYFVKRHLICAMKLKETSLFLNNLKPELIGRLENLNKGKTFFHPSLAMNRRYSNKPDSAILESYLKIQKQYHEEDLLESGIDSDYDFKITEFPINIEKLTEVYVNSMNDKLKSINMIDIFRLKSNGFTDIMNVNEALNIYKKDNTHYVVLKSNKNKDDYYFITESVSGIKKQFKVTLSSTSKNLDKDKMGALIESTFIK